MWQSGVERLQRAEAVEGWLWYKRVLPLGFASAATLAFGNMVYLYLDVGFIQMLKSFTPVIMVVVSHIANIEQATTPVIVSVAVICLGTAFTCSFVPHLNVLGILVMVFSMTSEAARMSLTQFFLQQLKFGVIEGAYVMSPASAMWLFAASFVFELPRMIDVEAFHYLWSHPSLFLVSAAMGVGVNFITYFMIQFTSSLTVKILVAVRNMLMVVLSVLFYGEVVTVNQGIGYFIALLGFAGYNMSKMGVFKDCTYLDAFQAMPVCVRWLLPSPAKMNSDDEGITLLGQNDV
jgi:drug/metabolite transporter (DMT)-like permease